MEYLDIVNEQDEVVGRVERQEAHQKKLPHRIVHVFVFNDRGEMAAQLRSDKVEFCPHHWITAVAGHVKAGQTYLEGARDEAQEELGVDNLQLEFMVKDLFDREGIGKLFLVSYRAKHNGPFSPRTDHVDRIEFFPLTKLQEMVNGGEKFHPEFLFLLKKHFNIQ